MDEFFDDPLFVNFLQKAYERPDEFPVEILREMQLAFHAGLETRKKQDAWATVQSVYPDIYVYSDEETEYGKEITVFKKDKQNMQIVGPIAHIGLVIGESPVLCMHMPDKEFFTEMCAAFLAAGNPCRAFVDDGVDLGSTAPTT